MIEEPRAHLEPVLAGVAAPRDVALHAVDLHGAPLHERKLRHLGRRQLGEGGGGAVACVAETHTAW